jgi:hypothetical protein
VHDTDGQRGQLPARHALDHAHPAPGQPGVDPEDTQCSPPSLLATMPREVAYA